MTRNRHRWFGAGLLCLIIAPLAADALRATSLIFSKSTSTTQASTVEEMSASDNSTETAVVENKSHKQASSETNSNSTRIQTGIPQIDYLTDPNLPRELNGYNMSSYPFFDILPKPESIAFKCDGLHDGFYASIPLKCQVYHHCIDGIRYDFLCANYTAFDQKTFICQFVHVVDCKNSEKYWNRNDALYKATTARTPPPTTPTTTVAPPSTRPPRRRPAHRFDYYDDDYYYRPGDYDYEERPGGRRPRPRPRPQGRPGGRKRRPYDDYEDERYERRPRPKDVQEDDYEERRPYERPRGAKRPDQRRPYSEDDDRRPAYRSRKPSRPREDDFVDEEEERPRDNPRRPNRDDEKIISSRPRDKLKDENRDEPRTRDEVSDDSKVYKSRDERVKEDDVRPREEKRPRGDSPFKSRHEKPARDEIKPREEIRSRDENTRLRDDIKPREETRNREDIQPRDETRIRDDIKPREESRSRDERRPLRDERPETKPITRQRDDRYSESRRYKDNGNRNREERPTKNDEIYDDEREDTKQYVAPSAPEGLVKPNGHGIYSKPRMPPKIKRPVPINAKEKYEYKTVTTTKPLAKVEDDEYYDDYEDETSKPSSSGKTSTIQQRPKVEPLEKEKFKPSKPHFSSPASYKVKGPAAPLDYEEEEYYYDSPYKSQKISYNQKEKHEEKRKVNDYYDDEEYIDRKKAPVKALEEELTTKIRNVKPSIKIFKRPFLPSRGGSPYLPRGLQPVGGKNLHSPLRTTPKPQTTSTTTTTTTTTTPKPTTTSTSTTTTTTTSTTTITTEAPSTTRKTTTTTAEPTTTYTTEKTSTTEQIKQAEEEYEYYDEEDVEYDPKLKPGEKSKYITIASKFKPEEQQMTTERVEIISYKPRTTTVEPLTTEEKAQTLAAQVFKVYNDNYKAINDRLVSTQKPFKTYSQPILESESVPVTPVRVEQPVSYKQIYITTPYENLIPKFETPSTIEPEIIPNSQIDYKFKYTPKPDISEPYTATGKPLVLPENISIKQNLADSVESEFDVRLNEAITPNFPNINLRAPSSFMIPTERDSRYRNNAFHIEPQYAASDINNYHLRKRPPQISGVSIRTPSSFYLQRVPSYGVQSTQVSPDDAYSRPPRQLLYRQMLGSFF